MTDRDWLVDMGDSEPSYQFDARFVVNQHRGPPCGVKIWLPLDCHDDARIEIVASDHGVAPADAGGDIERGFPRLLSDIDPKFGLEIEAEDLHVRRMSTKYGIKINGISITVDHIGCLRIKRKFPKIETHGNKLGVPQFQFAVNFHLSDLKYGLPYESEKMDYLGNREVKPIKVSLLRMHRAGKLVSLELQRHWKWRKTKLGRCIVGSFPVLAHCDNHQFAWDDLDEVRQVGRDACLLLTLAARHLTVMHAMVASTDQQQLEEWFNPLRRQRSTTEEEACGPLVDQNELPDYFDLASARWSSLTERQQDAVRLAVYAIHPFTRASIEAHYLQMFTALEGLARAWVPEFHKTHKKLQALIAKFPPRYAFAWPLTNADPDGLDAIRNLIAHGRGLRGDARDALTVGSDHLQVWIERLLLAILGFQPKGIPLQDWLTKHVQDQWDELPRLRAAIKAESNRTEHVAATENDPHVP